MNGEILPLEPERLTAASRRGSFLDGGGEMGSRMRSLDWSSNPLGPVERWSASLRTMTSILLANRFPMLLWWGTDSISIYNDAYIPVLGVKHPDALGQPVRECWSEIYDVLRPLIETPLNGGPPTWSEDLELEILRHGFREETHWTVAYSPVPDPAAPTGIGGVLATVHEITAQVVGDRRSALLRDLSASLAESRTDQEVCRSAVAVFERYPKDATFAQIYLVDEDERKARVAGGCGAGPPVRAEVDLADESAEDSPVAAVARVRTVQLVEHPLRSLVMPIESGLPRELAGVLVIGLSPMLALDASHRGFADLTAGVLSRAIANARAYETERRRAESLAELDRAKTTFFSNVSHELRTPLTLILGPLEEGLQDAPSAKQRERLEMVHRNAMRLLRLVNSLLDFSRLEAGRIHASYEPTDLGALTAEIASSFSGLVESAGLKFTMDCPPSPVQVWVDRQMWEKIVLNLVSNAFKFTFEGEISVRVESDGDAARLVVKDTGTGIDPEQLPHVFDRFYRVEGARGRTYEGVGIGLALVRELARQHGGAASVVSEAGKGATFTVAIPVGDAHLPKNRVHASRVLGSTAVRATTFVEEAAAWMGAESLVDSSAAGDGATSQDGASEPRILVADDNADMRAYLERLLIPLGSVETVANGREALEAIASRLPDLVLSDVMMPELDGLGLARTLREDERTRTLPVILISARAGEEARVEGLGAGVDDYVVKPFAASELVSRVRSQLDLARRRREHGDALRLANEQLREADRHKSEFLAVLSHELRNPLSPIRNSVHVLERAVPGGDQARRALAVLDRQTAQLARLVDDLLDVTRISRGKVQVQRETLELNDLVRRTIDDQRSFFDYASVRIELEPAPRTVFVYADWSRLAQIIGNLLQNAAKFTPPGGRVDVSISIDEATAKAQVQIADTGVGMTSETLASLFRPFVQADKTLDRNKGGLGLGLALAKGLVELHGGDVRAYSEGLGKGSRFVVTLPIDLRGADRPPRLAAVSTRRASRVLIIEDNIDAAESLREALQFGEHIVEVAHNGPEGIAKAREFGPDVVFCDVGLPGMDGYDVARAFRADESLRRVFLVALSGYAFPEDLQRSMDAGFARHISKPATLDRLEEILEDAPAS